MLATRDLIWARHPGFLLGSQSCRCAASVWLTPLTEAPGPRRTAGIRHLSHQHKLNRLIQCGSRPRVYRNILSDRIFSGVLVSGAVQGVKVRNCPISGAETGFSKDTQGWHSPDRLHSLFLTEQVQYINVEIIYIHIIYTLIHPWEIVLAADNNTANARQDPRKTGKQWDLIVERRWRGSGNTHPLQGARGFKRRI